MSAGPCVRMLLVRLSAAGLAASAKGSHCWPLRAAVVDAAMAALHVVDARTAGFVVDPFRSSRDAADAPGPRLSNLPECLLMSFACASQADPLGQAAGSILGYRSHGMLQLRGIFSGT